MPITQTYETTIVEGEFGIHFVIVPRDSLPEGAQGQLASAHKDPKGAIEAFGLQLLRSVPNLSVLPCAFASILMDDTADKAQWQLEQLIADPRALETLRLEKPQLVALAEYAAFADVIPFEASPIKKSSFAGIAVASVGAVGTGLGVLGQLAANPMCFLVASALTAGVMMIDGIAMVCAWKVQTAPAPTPPSPQLGSLPSAPPGGIEDHVTYIIIGGVKVPKHA